MAKYVVTTRDDEKIDKSEPIEFPTEKAATDDAQVALAEMAREKMPDGAQQDFEATVENGNGIEVYRASLSFRAQNAEGIQEADEQADEAAEDVASALRGGPRE